VLFEVKSKIVLCLNETLRKNIHINHSDQFEIKILQIGKCQKTITLIEVLEVNMNTTYFESHLT
jgi:hypothetical protein